MERETKGVDTINYYIDHICNYTITNDARNRFYISASN